MLGHALRTHSLQESHSGPTPSPAWDQAIVLRTAARSGTSAAADGSIRSRRSAGGLVTALEPLVQACSGTWVACGTLAGDTTTTTIVDGLDVRGADVRAIGCVTSACPRTEHRGYYYGFANEGLWPLVPCRSASSRYSDRATFWRIAPRTRASPRPSPTKPTARRRSLLVQDYHFALAPRELRHRLPLEHHRRRSGIFRGRRFMCFAICPVGRGLLDGLLGSNIVGFQTPDDCCELPRLRRVVLGAAGRPRVRHGQLPRPADAGSRLSGRRRVEQRGRA